MKITAKRNLYYKMTSRSFSKHKPLVSVTEKMSEKIINQTTITIQIMNLLLNHIKGMFIYIFF